MTRYRPTPNRTTPARALLLVALAAGLAACSEADRPLPLAPETPQWSAAVVEHDVAVPLSGTLDNPCTGEPVTFEGTANILVTERFVEGRPSQFVFHFNSRVTAVGTLSGATYTGHETDTYQSNARPGDVGEINEAFTLTLVSRGGAPNLRLTFLFHLTVNANGVQTVRILEEDVVCTG